MADTPKPEIPPPPEIPQRKDVPVTVDPRTLLVRPPEIAPPNDPFNLFAQVRDGRSALPVDPRTGELDLIRILPGRREPGANDLARLRETSPDRVLGRAALAMISGLLGERTASAPRDAAQAFADKRDSPGVGYGEQALNIAFAMLPLERLVAQGLKGFGVLEGYLAKGTATTAERQLVTVPRVGLEKGAAIEALPRPGATVRGVETTTDGFLPEVGEKFFDATPAKQFAKHLAQANAGERLCADVLASDGHRILTYKPDIHATNQGGIDLVTIVYDKVLQRDVVWLVDNKALTTGTNVKDVTALIENFNVNKANTIADMQQALGNQAMGKEERVLMDKAVHLLQNNEYKKVVTNMNFMASDRQVAQGVTERLKKNGVEFVDLRQFINPETATPR